MEETGKRVTYVDLDSEGSDDGSEKPAEPAMPDWAKTWKRSQTIAKVRRPRCREVANLRAPNEHQPAPGPALGSTDFPYFHRFDTSWADLHAIGDPDRVSSAECAPPTPQ